ncbi:unnamed protein product [Brachionus calyciflorus]|uniref:Glutathione S-transferase S1 n=1 Tax=Brachionus calyciflorus TaxID=104777 RepID=A0A813M6V0_9BILA|nr:unnamed protein product [Brachionus calyciflorus]
MTEYKLYYFNGKGRAEVIRLIFAAAGQKYQDIRFEREQWPELKPKTPLGNVPVLEVVQNGKSFKFGQSLSIARYVARKFSLAGRGDEEQAEVEMYGDQVQDLFLELLKIRFEVNEARKNELRKKFQEETLPNSLRVLDGKVAKNGSGYLVASGLTWADLFLFYVLDWLDRRVRSNPRIADWLERRPVTEL